MKSCRITDVVIVVILIQLFMYFKMEVAGNTVNHFFWQEKHNTYTSLASYFVGLTKYSRVNPISKIDLAPAHTTATGVLPSSVRSALISNAVKKEQWRCLISWCFLQINSFLEINSYFTTKYQNTMGTNSTDLTSHVD